MLKFSHTKLAWLKARGVQRLAGVFLVFCFCVAFIVATVRLTDTSRFLPSVFRPNIPACPAPTANNTSKIWADAQAKHAGLLDDKFTIAIQTYKRPRELSEILDNLLRDKIPSLLEIVVTWNEHETEPPHNFTSRYGVPVRFQASRKNSLNSRLAPDPDYRTQAILLSDDDVYYHPTDLEFAFQSWRKFGRDRLTGALARCTEVDGFGNWKYAFCPKTKEQDWYSLVLTNLAFTHVSFLEYYSSNDTTMAQVRQYVDEVFNCEDIAMNYVVSYLTGNGPLLVKGHDDYVNLEPSGGISKKSGHLETRSKCLNEMAKMFGCMPLVEETAHIRRGPR